MPSPRRLKIFGLLVLVLVVCVLFWTSSSRQSHDLSSSDDFYAKTVNALDKDNSKSGGSKAQAKLGEDEDEEVAKAMQERLKQAAADAKEKANAKAPKPDPPSAVVGKGSAAEGSRGDKAVGGRKKYGDDKQEVIKEEEVEETEEDKAVTVELTSILQKAPSQYIHHALPLPGN